MKKKNAFIIGLSIILVVGLFLLILFSTKIFKVNKNFGKDNSINDLSNLEVIKSSVSKQKVSPGAMLIFKKYYKKCDHLIVEKLSANKNIVNLTQEELKNLYKDWEIIKFTNDEIELYKEFDEECNEHYLVKSESGVINIYNIKESGEMELIEKTEIEIKYLPQEDRKQIEEGVVLSGKQSLNMYIENFE